MNGQAENPWVKKWLLAALLIGLGLGGWFYGVFLYLPQATVAPGVIVGSLQIGDLNISQAIIKLEPWLTGLEEKPVILTGSKGAFEFVPHKDGLAVDREKLKQLLLAVGRQGSLWEQWALRYQGHRENIPLVPPLKRVKEKQKAFFDKVNLEVSSKPVEPRVIVRPNKSIGIIPEKLGSRVHQRQAEMLLSRLFFQVENRQGLLPLEALASSLTAEEIQRQGIEELVAYFTTSFDAQNLNRVHNIKVAAGALNNILLLPGETFSFNETVGPRSTEKDYKEAKVIINNEFVPGTGGGVCQVSSTLYNAALLANQKIVERVNHSRPVSYLAAGRDATVVYGAIDLKFVNSRATPLLITAEVKGNRLTTYFFGQKKQGEEVLLESREAARVTQATKQLIDPTLPFGETVVEQGSPGIKVSLWRQLWLGDNLVNEEKISSDTYKKVDNLIRVGQDSKDQR